MAKKKPKKVAMIPRSYKLPETTLKAADEVADKLGMGDVMGAHSVIVRRALAYGLRAFLKNPELAKKASSITL